VSSVIRELKRRKVFRVAVVYAATAFVVLQAADLLAAGLRLPEWVFPAVTVLVILGFPVALVLGWALELTPGGIRRTGPGPQAEAGGTTSGDAQVPAALGRGTLLVAAGLVLVGIGLGAGWFLRPLPAAPDGAGYPVAAPSAEPRSLAVLPFVDLSEAADQKWFAEGLAEEILTSLARLPELRVIGRNSSFLFTAGAVDDRVIADTLGVAHLVKGSVRRVGDRIRVSAQLVRAGDGVQIWSESYDRAAEDLLDVQRDVAEKVAAALDVFLDDERRARMFAAGTRNVEAFDAFLRGLDLFRAAHRDDRRRPATGDGGTEATLAEANDWFARALALDPELARAAFLYADRYGHIAVDGLGGRLVGAHDLTPEQAMERYRATFEPVARRARDPHARVLAEINRVFFSSDWRRLPTLLDGLLTHAAADQHSMDDTWGPFAWLVLGRVELSRELSARMVRSEPLDPIGWHQRVQTEMAAGDLAAARALIREAVRHLPGFADSYRERELSIALLEGNRDAVLELLDGQSDPIGFAAAVRGDTALALERAAALEAALGWPYSRLLRVYHQLGDRERARALVARIDAMPSGPVILARELSLTGVALTFDPADAPNFSARLREAGVDPASFPVMPRLSAGGRAQP
jgi:adenylate cyclase